MNTGEGPDDFREWHSCFAARARRPVPSLDASQDPIPGPLRGELIRSLARFQIGEAGEGRITTEIRHVKLRGVTRSYADALELFVAEEGRHAGILAGLIRSLGGKTLEATWTERLFVKARRLAGVRFKLLVLFAAEVIGIGFYGLAADALPGGKLQATLDEIRRDERVHLAFHGAFFRANLANGLERFAFRVAFALVAGAASLVVLIDHRKTLASLGVPLQQAAGTFRGLVAEALGRVAYSGRGRLAYQSA